MHVARASQMAMGSYPGSPSSTSVHGHPVHGFGPRIEERVTVVCLDVLGMGRSIGAAGWPAMLYLAGLCAQ